LRLLQLLFISSCQNQLQAGSPEPVSQRKAKAARSASDNRNLAASNVLAA
jgi:hypothetical protein